MDTDETQINKNIRKEKFPICVSSVPICGRNLLPKLRQFFRAEVGEDLAVHLNHRRERLAGELDHFRHRLFIGDDINLLVLDAALVEPALRLVAPAAIRFDKETDFHELNGLLFVG